MKMINVIVALVGMSFFQILSANQFKVETINYEFAKNQFTPLTFYTQSEAVDRKRSYLKNLFDHQASTAWYTNTLPSTYQGGTPSIVINFNEQAYVSGIRVLPCSGSNNPEAIRFFVEKKISLSDLWDFGTSYRLKNQQTYQDITFVKDGDEKYIYDLFPAKRIVIEILASGEDKASICISEIQILMTKELTYSPAYSFNEVKKYIYKNTDYLKTHSDWKFLDIWSENERNKNNDYFVDLTFYALKGNEEAQRMFLKSNPFNEETVGTMVDIYKPLMKELMGIKEK
jgi:hypothetical protein